MVDNNEDSFVRVTLEHIINGIVVSGRITSDDRWTEALAAQANCAYSSLNLAVQNIINRMTYELDAISGRPMTAEEEQRLVACLAWLDAMPVSSGDEKEVEDVRKYYQDIKNQSRTT